MSKPKPVFYAVLRGLRGCYMPDEAGHYAARTFEAFCADLQQQVSFHDLRWNIDPDRTTQHGMVDALLRDAWNHVQNGSLELCVAVGVEYDREGNAYGLDKSYGLTVGSSSARELLEFRREMRDTN